MELESILSLRGYKRILVVSVECFENSLGSIGYIEKEYRNKIVNEGEIGDTDIADIMVLVLGCSKDDLAIVKSLHVAESYSAKYDGVDIYLGGCMACIDIELPSYIKGVIDTKLTLDIPMDILKISKVKCERQYWELERVNKSSCNIIKIDKGLKSCSKYAKGCLSIVEIEDKLSSVKQGELVEIVSEGLDSKRLEMILSLIERYKVKVGFREIRTEVIVSQHKRLKEISELGLIEYISSAITSDNDKVLIDLGYDVCYINDAIKIMGELRELGVKVYTRVLVDYNKVTGDGKQIRYSNTSQRWLNDHFDGWSWEIYYDGKWDKEKAIERYNEYVVKGL